MNGEVLVKIVGFVAFMFSIIVHEDAHGVVAERLGDTTARDAGRITLNPLPHIDPIGSVIFPLLAMVSGLPMFGWARPVPVNTLNLRRPIRDHAIVAAAGPASNFLLAFATVLLWVAVRLIFKHAPALYETAGPTLAFVDTLCRSLIAINCILAVFNLLPIPPLDGHWIAMRFLPDGARIALASVGRFGFLILLVLIWTGALWWIIGPAYRMTVSGYYAMVRIALQAL